MGRIPDEVLIQLLHTGDPQEVDDTLKYLHKQVYSMTSKFVNKYKGTEADAEDVFQDSMVALYKLARQGKLAITANVEAYLFTISKNLWFKQLRKRHETVEYSSELDVLPELDGLPLFSLLAEEQQHAFTALLKRFGEDCQKVLFAYYYEKTRMAKIAEMMGYANEQVAKNKKADCMKRLKGFLSEVPHLLDNLKL